MLSKNHPRTVREPSTGATQVLLPHLMLTSQTSGTSEIIQKTVHPPFLANHLLWLVSRVNWAQNLLWIVTITHKSVARPQYASSHAEYSSGRYR